MLSFEWIILSFSRWSTYYLMSIFHQSNIITVIVNWRFEFSKFDFMTGHFSCLKVQPLRITQRQPVITFFIASFEVLTREWHTTAYCTLRHCPWKTPEGALRATDTKVQVLTKVKLEETIDSAKCHFSKVDGWCVDIRYLKANHLQFWDGRKYIIIIFCYQWAMV